MTNHTHVKECTDHFNKHGFGAEEVFKTRALCYIADVLANIASDIRAIRENTDRKEDTND